MMIDGHIHRGVTQFVGEIAFLPFGLSRDEQFQKLHNRDSFHPLAACAVSSLIAIINPEKIALTGYLLQPDDIGTIRDECLKYTPKVHMPQLIILENQDEDYIYGLIMLTLESLSYPLKIVGKRR
ncbi:hypothetical protein [Paenibacillus riograndensis]|uniref:hypothetical protein n=1 Tax=Paenibacillus riograndensis TaxID=483937 RepID=UPI000B235DB0|nr:hypothetical protein [Paenibacillus riograndensis]